MLQMEERALASTMTREAASWTCTPHRRRARFHIRFDDFIDICESDDVNADALRVFENKTNLRIAWLRKEFGIPGDSLPHEDDLWIEVSLRSLEEWTLRAQSKSTFARCLRDQTYEEEPPSLLELGYLRRRFIARSAGGPTLKPATTVYLDERGEPFILVDSRGFYVDHEGQEHSAISEGYTLIARQYLYNIEAVNAAIAALDDAEPPGEVPRWPRVAIREKPRPGKQRGAHAHETTKSTDASDAPDENASMQRSAVQGGTKNTAQSIVPFDKQNNTDSAVTQTAQGQPGLLRSDPEAVRSLPWSAATLLALTAQLLAVPDVAQCDAQVWEVEWAQPAQALCALPEFAGTDPRTIWEQIERRIRGMTDATSPSWWVQGRAQFSPVTLRHVRNNWRAVGMELERAGWYSAVVVPYDGPPYDFASDDEAAVEGGYAQGYLETVVAISEVRDDEGGCATTSQPPPDEEFEQYPPPDRRMDRETAMGLARHIRACYPTINIGLRKDESSTVVVIEYEAHRWYGFATLEDWRERDEEARYYIELAARYGAQRLARPPGN